MFDSAVTCLEGIPRVENKIFSLLEEHLTIHLNVLTADATSTNSVENAKERAPVGLIQWADAFGELKSKCMSVFNAGYVECVHTVPIIYDIGQLGISYSCPLHLFVCRLKDAQSLRSMYDQLSYILLEEQKVTEFLKVPHALGDYDAQVRSYRSLAERIQQDTCSHLPAQMLLIDCTAVNRELSQQCLARAEQILQFVATRAVDR